jgi:cyclase
VPASGPVLRETVLSARLRLYTLGGDGPLTSYGANCLALAGRNGSLVVDPLIAPAHARLVEAALLRAGFPPVTHVVLTHHHTDHALGAGHFARRGASVVAHERCADAMRAQHPAVVLARRRDPSLALLFADAEPHLPAHLHLGRCEVDLGDVSAEVLHLGPGHTSGDSVVVLPSESAVATGDLVFRGYHFNYEEAEPGGVRSGLLALRGLGSRFVPGHGDAAGAEVLDEQLRYHDEAERIALASSTEGEGASALVNRFPAHLLRAAAPGAIRFWRGSRGRQGPG